MAMKKAPKMAPTKKALIGAKKKPLGPRPPAAKKKTASKRSPGPKKGVRNPKKPRGTPGPDKILVNWGMFDALCQMQCSANEVSSVMGISIDTLYRRAREDFDMTLKDLMLQKSHKGKAALRRRQYEVAMTGDRTMLIWLGKNELNQSDKIEAKQEVKVSTADEKLSKLSVEELVQLNDLTLKMEKDEPR